MSTNSNNRKISITFKVSSDTKDYIDDRISELNYLKKMKLNRTGYLNKLIELDQRYNVIDSYCDSDKKKSK